MAKLLKLRRGNTSQHGSFTGAEGEVTVDTDKETLVVHNGSTAGGFPVLRATGGSQNLSTSGTAATGALTVTGNIAVSGTVDGRDVAADGTKLDGIETSATADQTAAEIRTLVESASDSNVFTDADHTKLNGIETGATADQTKSDIDSLNINADTVDSLHASSFLRSDADDTTTGNLTISNSAPKIDFVDTNADSDFQLKGNAGKFEIIDTTNSAERFRVNSDGHVDVVGNLDVGAGVDVTGNITVSGTVDGRDVAADGTKLDGIEAGATADQTGAEISAALDGQDIYTDQKIGRDVGDYIQFTNNSHCDMYINSNNEFRFEADGDFHADGDVIAYSTTVASDENLKKDITTVTDAVTKVEALKGVTFTWKKNDNTSAGVIAQDVEKVLPQVVKTVSNPSGDEYKAVNYGGLTSILIEAIKDLSARVKVLEAK